MSIVFTKYFADHAYPIKIDFVDKTFPIDKI